MSRIQQVAVNFTASGQFGPWIKLDWFEPPFDLSILVSEDQGGTNPLTLQYIIDDAGPGMERQVMVTQTTTTITVTDAGPPLPIASGGGLGHGLAAGDFYYLHSTTNIGNGSIDGLYTVATAPTATTLTLTTAISQSLPAQYATGVGGKLITAGAGGDKIIGANGAGIVARTALNMTSPIWALRLASTGTFVAAAVARLVTIQGGASS